MPRRVQDPRNKAVLKIRYEKFFFMASLPPEVFLKKIRKRRTSSNDKICPRCFTQDERKNSKTKVYNFSAKRTSERLKTQILTLF